MEMNLLLKSSQQYKMVHSAFTPVKYLQALSLLQIDQATLTC